MRSLSLDAQNAVSTHREREAMTPFDLTSGARSEVFTFQGPKGDSVQAAIEVASDGLFIFVESFEFPVAKVDLFYLLESIEGKTAPQVIAYDTQREEAVG